MLQVKLLLCSAKAVLRDIPRAHGGETSGVSPATAGSAHDPAPSLVQAETSQSPTSRTAFSLHNPLWSSRAAYAAAAATHHKCSSALSSLPQVEFTSGIPAEHECCIVCMERAAVVMFVPCGHMLTCQACAAACLQRRPECLMCRSKVLNQKLQTSTGP